MMLLRVLIQIDLCLSDVRGIFQGADARLPAAALLGAAAAAEALIDMTDTGPDKIEIAVLVTVATDGVRLHTGRNVVQD